MPFEVRLDGPLIRLAFHGDVSAAELTAATKEMKHIEAGFDRTPDRITDLSDMTSKQSRFTSILDIARSRRSRVFPNRFRSALVAPNATARGFARMFQTLNTNPQIDVRIFETVADAEAWLAETPQRTGEV